MAQNCVIGWLQQEEVCRTMRAVITDEQTQKQETPASRGFCNKRFRMTELRY